MSYTQTTDPKAPSARSPSEVVVSIEEADLATDSEWVLDGLPDRITIVRFCAALTTPGSATTIQPELGRVAGWASEGSPDHISQQATAAAFINDFTVLRVALPDGKLYGRSAPDVATGAAGRVKTELAFLPGWVL